MVFKSRQWLVLSNNDLLEPNVLGIVCRTTHLCMYILLPKIFNLICLLPTLDDLKLFGLYIASNSETLKKVTYIRLTVREHISTFQIFP